MVIWKLEGRVDEYSHTSKTHANDRTRKKYTHACQKITRKSHMEIDTCK